MQSFPTFVNWKNSIRANFLSIQIHNSIIHILYQLYIVRKPNETIFYNKNPLFQLHVQGLEMKSMDCSYSVKNSMKGLKFLGQIPKPSWTWKLHKRPLQMNSN